jgi:DNA repair photolyase
MEMISAKTMVTKTKNALWFGTDYNMNIYRGCSHGCIYCDSRSECYHIDHFDEVRAKENSALLIDRELQGKRKTGVIGTGAMSDPYNPFEKTYELTRAALKVINRNEFGVAIATKSDLISRDVDLLKAIMAHSPVLAKITITAAEDALSQKVEPHAPPSSARFKGIEALVKEGVFAGVLLMPVLPSIEDDHGNIEAIIQMAYESGAKFVYPGFGVTLRQNQRDYYYSALDKTFPGLKSKYIKMYCDAYSCTSPNAKVLYQILKKQCEERGMLYTMKDIISAYKKGYEDKQISLFD